MELSSLDRWSCLTLSDSPALPCLTHIVSLPQAMPAITRPLYTMCLEVNTFAFYTYCRVYESQRRKFMSSTWRYAKYQKWFKNEVYLYLF